MEYLVGAADEKKRDFVAAGHHTRTQATGALRWRIPITAFRRFGSGSNPIANAFWILALHAKPATRRACFPLSFAPSDFSKTRTGHSGFCRRPAGAPISSSARLARSEERRVGKEWVRTCR